MAVAQDKRASELTAPVSIADTDVFAGYRPGTGGEPNLDIRASAGLIRAPILAGLAAGDVAVGADGVLLAADDQGSGSIERAITAKLRGLIDATDYVHTADAGDFGLALNRVMTTLALTGGGKFYVPPGDYTISTTVNYIDNVHADGFRAVIVPGADVNIFNLGNKNGVKISGFVFQDVAGAPVLAPSHAFIQGASCRNVEIFGNTFANHGSSAIRADSPTALDVHNNYFIDGYDSNALDDGTTTDVTVFNTINGFHHHNNWHFGRATNNKAIAVLVTTLDGTYSWKDVNVSENHCEDYRRGGLYIGGEGFDPTLERITGSILRGNKVYRSGQEGIKFKGGWNSVVDGNTVDGFELRRREINGNLQSGIFIQFMPGSNATNNKVIGRDAVYETGTVVSSSAATKFIADATTIMTDTVSGVASSGSAHGKVVHVTGGTGSGQYRQISAYNAGTREVTVSSAFSPQLDNTSTYEIRTNPSTGMKVSFGASACAYGTLSRGRANITIADNHFEDVDCGIELTPRSYHVHIGANHYWDCGQALLLDGTGGVGDEQLSFVQVKGGQFRFINKKIGKPVIDAKTMRVLQIDSFQIEGGGTYGFAGNGIDELQLSLMQIFSCGQLATGHAIRLTNVTKAQIDNCRGANWNGATSQLYGLSFGTGNGDILISNSDFSGNATGEVLTTNMPASIQFNGCGGTYAKLYGSATVDPASLVDGAGTTADVTVTGAALGDFVQAAFSLNLQSITMTAWVLSADTVRVRFQNESTATVDLASGTLRAVVTPKRCFGF